MIDEDDPDSINYDPWEHDYHSRDYEEKNYKSNHYQRNKHKNTYDYDGPKLSFTQSLSLMIFEIIIVYLVLFILRLIGKCIGLVGDAFGFGGIVFCFIVGIVILNYIFNLPSNNNTNDIKDKKFEHVTNIPEGVIIKKDISFKVYEEKNVNYYEKGFFSYAKLNWTVSKTIINKLKEDNIPYYLKLVWADKGVLFDEEKINILIEKYGSSDKASFYINLDDLTECFGEIEWDKSINNYL